MLTHSPKDLAAFVVNQRKKLNLSQADVGALVGLKQQTISEFEKNPAGTKMETLFRILSAVNLDMHLLTKDQPIIHKKSWQEEW